MKSKFILVSALLFSSLSIYAQGEMDAYKLSQNSLTGTARSISMGGAFGALGGDISSISINPAGIGVYKSSEIVTTLNLQSTKTTGEMNLGKLDEKKFNVNFNNLAFVTSFPLDSDVAPFLNFGFSYNRLKNFNRKYSVVGDNVRSMAGYMADRATSQNIANADRLWFSDSNDPFYNTDGYDWLAILGYNSFLIEETALGSRQYQALPLLNGTRAVSDLFVEEKGSINSYDFNMGTTFSDIISAGISVSITDIDYRRFTSYIEDYPAYGSGNTVNGFTLENGLKTEGTGVQVSAGIIIKPINELRIGIAYHSPTWYEMTDYFDASINYDVRDILPSVGENAQGNIYSGDNHLFDYKFRSPDKLTLSLAGVIGQTAIISADYEFTNYKNNMKVLNRNGSELLHNPNRAIKDHFKGASTIRIGAEVRFTPQFSGRVGYAWMQSPLEKDFKNGAYEVGTVGADPHLVLDGDTNYITYGLGYRFTRNFYTDIAFVMGSQKSDLYMFSKTGTNDNGNITMPEKASLKTNTFQGLLTLGYKF